MYDQFIETWEGKEMYGSFVDDWKTPDEYISRKAVDEMLENAQIISDGENCGYCTEDIAIRSIPAADVAPVVHAKWSWITEDKYRCTNCGRITRVDECMGEPMYIACPYCTAKMDGGK